jgi:hypothetical protein
MEDAEKMFKELYPASIGKEPKKFISNEISEIDWNSDTRAEIDAALDSAFLSKKQHSESIISGNDSSILRIERQKQMNNAKKILLDWVKNISDDLESTKEQVLITQNEIGLISSNVQNMIRLISEFSDQFAESLHRILIPSKKK